MTGLAKESGQVPDVAQPARHRAGTLIGACGTLLKATLRRWRHRPGRAGVLYLLETGGPGGAERMLVDLAATIGPSWQATVAVMKRGWLQAHAASAGIPSVVVEGGGLGDLGVLQRLVEVVETHEIAVIHAHEFYMSVIGAVLSSVTGAPLVVTIHGKSYYPDKRRRRLACRALTAVAAQVITVSDDLHRFFCDTTGAPPARVRVIYNGIVLPPPPPYEATHSEIRDAAGIPRDAPLIGAVGSLYPVKGHLDLIRATPTILKRHPAGHVVILGRGPLHDTLTAEARSLNVGDRIHLLGHRDDVRAWLSTLNIFTMPSLSEGLPLSLLEAMAAGVPCVVSAVGGMPEVVQDGQTGMLVPPGDVEALAERLCFLFENPLLAAKMGAAGRDRVFDRFTIDRMAADYHEVYRQAVNSPAA